MKRDALVRYRVDILRRTALIGAIAAGGLMWVYTMARLAGFDLLPGLPLDGVVQVVSDAL